MFTTPTWITENRVAQRQKHGEKTNLTIKKCWDRKKFASVHQITGHIDFYEKCFLKTFTQRQVNQKISWLGKF